MELIEFLMRNFWLVFIIIAILSGLSRGAKRPDQNPNKSMPPFGGGNPGQPQRENPQPSSVDTYEDKYDEERGHGGTFERPEEGRRQPEVVLSERRRELETRMRETAALSANRPRLAQEEIGSVDMIQEQLKDSDSPIFNQQNNSAELARKSNNLRQKAIEGIIWAEILGPPRSRRMQRK
ncbi:hypothetical protein [Paenibacillus senegalensis]|uniref:hypothetical protein n=1 Tax=Paenibacillus senegalensis TaxID=1465766 RepID=UPI000287A91D|nr:hypothetical protein [Paenibacillus senegalensis]